MIAIFENLLLFLVIMCSLLVLIVNNPVQSLLWLIITFALSSMLFMIFGVEFLSLLIFMIYIGAIAVLFLFVIMMLNIKVIELRFFYLRYLSIGATIVCFFILEIFLSILFEFNSTFYSNNFYYNWFVFIDLKSNLFNIGSIIFDYNFIFFLMLGLILFIAMICSIVLLVNWNLKIIKMRYYDDIYFFSKKKIVFLK
jgi:NADH-quinone oxidoreductase subunit J